MATEKRASSGKIPTMDLEPARRPLAIRRREWTRQLARVLGSAGISPDAISIAGFVFAVIAGVLIWRSGTDGAIARVAELVSAAGLIQLRLLCNLLDGLVA